MTDAQTAASRPPVSVVVATRSREELLGQALASIEQQDYAGDIEVVVVYDQSPAQRQHERVGHHGGAARSVTVASNDRRLGLAGARNTGILAASGRYVGFCDDDDSWRPAKLSRQVQLMQATGSIACVTGICIHYDGGRTERIPAADTITVPMLTRSRVTGAHPSSYLFDRSRVLDDVGLVDEQLPGGYGEDYDWLLRLAAAGPIGVVREPLVDVLWHRGSYFSSRWSTIIDALEYLVAKHPDIAADRPGRARILGQQAFATAALGSRAPALRLAARTLRENPREQRAYAAALVACGIISADAVVHQANRRGRGI